MAEPPQRSASEEHYNLAQQLVVGALHRYVGTLTDGLLDSAKTHELLAAEQIMETVYFSSSFGELRLMGQHEAVQCLELNNRQRLGQLRVAKSLNFPEPIAELAMGPVWLARDIERFKEGWQRKPGRPAKVKENTA